MNKAETIDAVAKSTGVAVTTVGTVLNGFIETTTQALKKGDNVNLTGFGKFEVRRREARKGTNPKTGEKLKIKARTVAKFSVGQTLRDAVLNAKA